MTWWQTEEAFGVYMQGHLGQLFDERPYDREPDVDVEFQPPGEEMEDDPPSWGGKVYTAAVIMAELAVSMIPGYDFYEIMREYVYKPYFLGEAPDWVNGILSFVGLVADAGYLTPVTAGVSVVANAGVAVLRVVLKNLPPGAIKFLQDAAKLGLDTLNYARKLTKWVNRVLGSAPNFSLCRFGRQWHKPPPGMNAWAVVNRSFQGSFLHNILRDRVFVWCVVAIALVF